LTFIAKPYGAWRPTRQWVRSETPRGAVVTFVAFAFAVTLAAALAFWWPAWRATGGVFPAPLDDVYIHFAFARSAALGHPFAWIPGQGYSSGGTSLLYPLLLAPGWLVGFRGTSLGFFAAALALLCVVDLARSLARLFGPRLGLFAFVIPPVLVAVPLADWSLFSGMETALVAAVVGRALVAAERACFAPPTTRARAQLHFGLVAALLYASRPELLALALPLGIAVVRGARGLATRPSLIRALGPSLAIVAAQAIANRTFTGEWAAAGAVRKLITEDPYVAPLDAALVVLKNLTVLRTEAFELGLGGAPWSLVFPALALLALFAKETRRLAVPLFVGGLGALALACLNVTAPYQNFRYAVPSLLLLLATALLGAAVLARRGRVGALVATALLASACFASFGELSRQTSHFARASRNIAEQQVEVARRLLSREPGPRRVFLNDAGAIPYLTGLSAIDGFGLGGFHDLPFARASVHGAPCVYELLERLAPEERPDLLAIYDAWWPGMERFGARVDGVRIEDNVICGAPEKVVRLADWSLLRSPDAATPGAVAELDVADLVDERAHLYALPAPGAGYAIQAVRDDAAGKPRWDGGRLVPEGVSESFAVPVALSPGPALLFARTDAPGVRVHVEVTRNGAVVAIAERVLEGGAEGAWLECPIPLSDVRGGDRVVLRPLGGTLRSFHYALVRR
jgi:hypothetical protein